MNVSRPEIHHVRDGSLPPFHMWPDPEPQKGDKKDNKSETLWRERSYDGVPQWNRADGDQKWLWHRANTAIPVMATLTTKIDLPVEGGIPHSLEVL